MVTVLSCWSRTMRAVVLLAAISHTTALDHIARHLIDLVVRVLM